MKLKSLVTMLLMVFVGVSIGFLVFKESRKPTEAKVQTVQAPEQESRQADQSEVIEKDESPIPAKKAEARLEANGAGKKPADTAPVNVVGKSEPASKVVAYYFHGNVRCYTCRMIEDYSRIAVTTGFPDEMNTGKVVFRSINVEDPGNEHFVNEYKLVTRSVVLVRLAGDKQEQWKNLGRVWELVRNKDAFERYVRDETKKFLEES